MFMSSLHQDRATDFTARKGSGRARLCCKQRSAQAVTLQAVQRCTCSSTLQSLLWHCHCQWQPATRQAHGLALTGQWGPSMATSPVVLCSAKPLQGHPLGFRTLPASPALVLTKAMHRTCQVRYLTESAAAGCASALLPLHPPLPGNSKMMFPYWQHFHTSIIGMP